MIYMLFGVVLALTAILAVLIMILQEVKKQPAELSTHVAAIRPMAQVFSPNPPAKIPATVRVYRRDHRGEFLPAEHVSFGSDIHLLLRGKPGIRIKLTDGTWEGE